MSDVVVPGGAAQLVVAGARLLADPLGGLYWPERAVLAIADLHLEKGAAFARAGVMLPPYDTPDTLMVVERLIGRYRPQTVIALGDSFHRGDSHLRLGAEMRGRLQALAGGRRWIWVSGNHDPEPPPGLGGEAASEVSLGALTFRHEPSASGGAGEIAGHLHPVARLTRRGRSLRRRCFAASAMRVVMPALGAYAGGLNVLDDAFAALFPGRDFRAWMLGGRRVYRLAPPRLSADAGASAPWRAGAA